MDQTSLSIVVIVVLGALLWLKFYGRPKLRNRQEYKPPPPPPAPQGPRPPQGLPMPDPNPPIEGNFGPQYLTGEIKEESKQALELIRPNLLPQDRQKIDGWPDSDLVYAMAADFLGAMRWYGRSVAKTPTGERYPPGFWDKYFSPLLLQTPESIIERIIDMYRELPPSTDRDQALRILGFYLQNNEPGTSPWKARMVATAGLRGKAEKDEAGAQA
jgi:hypothetical protein